MVHLHKFDIHSSIGPDRMPAKEPKKPADVSSTPVCHFRSFGEHLLYGQTIVRQGGAL